MTEPLTLGTSLIGDKLRINIRRSRLLILRSKDSKEEMVNKLRL